MCSWLSLVLEIIYYLFVKRKKKYSQICFSNGEPLFDTLSLGAVGQYENNYYLLLQMWLIILQVNCQLIIFRLSYISGSQIIPMCDLWNPWYKSHWNWWSTNLSVTPWVLLCASQQLIFFYNNIDTKQETWMSASYIAEPKWLLFSELSPKTPYETWYISCSVLFSIVTETADVHLPVFGLPPALMWLTLLNTGSIM